MSDWLNRVHFGDCLETLRRMPDGLVQTCVTSPPYYGLRDYGHAGQIGLEASPEEFISKLVDVFREVRRVLRDDGTCWVNMGDSYANDSKWGGSSGGKHVQALHGNTGVGRGKKTTGLKGKDLIGVPWMLAFALRADGWYLRQEIIWSKPNPMPESVTDRCTKAHESIFLLAKSAIYYCDMAAIKEPALAGPAGNVNPQKGAIAYAEGDERHRTKVGLTAFAERSRSKRDSFKREDSKRDSFKREDSKRAEAIPGQSTGTHRADRDESDYPLDVRNKRSVWTVSTKPYSGAHFATFPPDLIEPCILAGAPAGGVVLDPFFGSGTTGQVAQNLGRAWIGCELNPEYEPLQRERLAQRGLELA